MVSGHPFDGLKFYCQRRSSNIGYLKKDMQEIIQEEEQDKEKFKKKIEKIQVKAIGIITDIRKIVTKTGKNMMFLTCE
jgi:DNA polymerase III alpha subunit